MSIRRDGSLRLGHGGAVTRMKAEWVRGPATLLRMSRCSPFRFFRSSPEIIRLAVMMNVRFPLSLRNVRAYVANAHTPAGVDHD